MKTTSTYASLLIGHAAKRLVVIAVLILADLAGTTHAAVKASRAQITIPTYPWAAVKHPYLRGTDKVNIYPYPMLDFISRDKTNRTYQTVVLQNEYLRITFLPELGGRIHEVIDKTTGQPMFYVNHVIKPGLIGQCGAWISGGVEWNTGPQGHTVSCMQPMDFKILPPHQDGSRSVAIGETERIYDTKWTVVVTLRPGRSFIEERIRIYNPTETVRPYYFWNCTAVPNTPGFRFIYPMTLGTDHGAEKFFRWPIDNGKDLSRGASYQDASSIFAWYCDQDFFGSYNDDLDRGVVAYANHHQLPGKKAWTWGHGSYGTMHQMDLTDTDGPYNEVQTGPLLTQGEVGRLDPCEAVEWKEWWYPIHRLGGFTFANKDLAVNAAMENGKLRLRILGSGSWKNVETKVRKDQRQLAATRCALTPRAPVDLTLNVAGTQEPFDVELRTSHQTLARFRYPLDLPLRQPPEKKRPPQTAAEFAHVGWQEFLFARFPGAESAFRNALDQDPNCVEAHTGLAYLNLDREPAAAAQAAQAALAVDPDCGRARFARAVAEDRLGDATAALDDAWKAALDPVTAVAGRALAASLLLRRLDYDGAIRTLSEVGPWLTDTVCRNRLAFANHSRGRLSEARRLAELNLASDPLDGFARKMLAWTTTTSRPTPAPLPCAELEAQSAGPDDTGQPTLLAPFGTGSDPWPHRYADLDPLRRLVAEHPNSGRETLALAHLLFHLGRYSEGRAMWKKAAELGAQPVIACRALGVAARMLDGDLQAAREWLEKANRADPTDAIVARDLANVLFALADQTDPDAGKRGLTTEARDLLKGAFQAGKGRSDFVALLARAQNRLGEFTETSRMLDSVRVTIWEGAHEVHDLFEQAHLALGQAHLKAGRPAEALTEFNRALEYPPNLATGKLEITREAHILYWRGNALAASGQKQAAMEAWQKAAAEQASKDEKIEEARRLAREAIAKAATPL